MLGHLPVSAIHKVTQIGYAKRIIQPLLGEILTFEMQFRTGIISWIIDGV